MVVVWMILESGAIYSVAVIFLVAFGAMKTQVGGLISNIFTQLCVSICYSVRILFIMQG